MSGWVYLPFLNLIVLATLGFGQIAIGQEYVPGEVIIKLRGQPDSQASYAFMGKAHSQKSMNLKRSFGKMNLHHFILGKGQRVEDVVAELRNDPEVEYAEPNYIFRKADEVGIIRSFTHEEMQAMAVQYSQGSVVWATGGVDIGLDQFHLSKSMGSLASSKPVVAVIDTGLDLHHPVFNNTNSIWINPGESGKDQNDNDRETNGIDDDGNGFIDDVNGWNFVDNTSTMYDDDGHGTHVSGIILSVDQDIQAVSLQNSRIAIMPLKFLDGNGIGTTSNAIRAIYYAVQNGAVVLNNSWGGPSYSGALHEAIAYAYNSGAAFVAAAGNSAHNNDSKPLYPANYDVPNVISTAATTGADTLATFSNYGANSVHLGSPGVGIYSTIPGGWGYASGTSMATPFVAGVAIQMKVESPNMLGYQVKQIIFAQSDQVAGLLNKVYTDGRVNAANAITYSQSATVDPSQPAYYGAFSQNRELASSLAGGGCGLVTKMLNDSKNKFDGKGGDGGPGVQGPETWYILIVLALMALPVLLMHWLRTLNPENRRRYERFRINSDVSVHVGGRELVGSISSISLGGVQLNTDALLENGGIVKMSISSPDGKEQLEVEGHVVWSEAKKAYGVAFDNAPRSVLYRIGEWTRALQRTG